MSKRSAALLEAHRVRPKLDAYAMVTERLVESLESGTVPWRTAWTDESLPINMTSGKAYRGINPFLLEMVARSQGYAEPYWATYRRVRELGGQVRKGESGALVVFYEPQRRRYRYYRVFNVAQVDGLSDVESYLGPRVELAHVERAVEKIERFLENGSAPVGSAATLATKLALALVGEPMEAPIDYAKYLTHWAALLERHPQLAVYAGAAAQRAVDHILGEEVTV